MRHTMTTSAALLTLCLAATAVAQSDEQGQDRVPITVTERGGVDRRNELVRFGLPLPESWNVGAPADLQLERADGTPVPAQFAVTARWGAPPQDETAPVKWLLVSYLESVAANDQATVVLRPRAAPAPATGIEISRDDARLTVSTGAAEFVINTGDTFNLLEQVVINGTEMLTSLSANRAIDYAPLDGVSIVRGGRPDLTPRATAVEVERRGPLDAVVRVTGSLRNDGGDAVLDFTTRLYFAAESSAVRLDFTVENNHPIELGEYEQPANAHDQGAVNSVYVGDLALRVQLENAERPTVLTELDTRVDSLSAALRLDQDSSGTDFWDNYVGEVGWPGEEASAHPRLQSYCSRPGFEIAGDGLTEVKSGRQALGWMSLGGNGPAPRTLTVAVRDFWQNFPKSLEAAPDGSMSIHLFPRGDRFHHNLRVGEEKTHSVLLQFSDAAPDAAGSERVARAFNEPLFGVAPATWYAAAGALGEVPAADVEQWPLYERYVRVAFEPNPDFDPARDDPNFGNRTLREVQEFYNFYGWQDYGDVPLDYEGFGERQAGQMNLKYWYVYGMLLQFCRSGDERWLDVARPAARHLADIDFLHVPDEGPQHWSHGAYFGHSQHNESGNENPNRNWNSPSADLFYGVPDLLLAYQLTGQARFRDVALEGLSSMQAMSQFGNFNDPILQRDRANLIFGYMEAYRHTGESVWLDELRQVVEATCVLDNKPWLRGPAAYFRTRPDDFQSMFQFAQTVWSLGRYLDFCAEYDLEDDLGARDALLGYADFLLEHATVEYAPGRTAFPSQVRFPADHPEMYLEIDNWALVAADLLAYAFKYSGEDRYLAAAETYYATGVTDPVWQDDPPVYLASKDLVNSLNWGLVYMNQSRLRR